MFGFIVRRILWIIPILLFISMVTFTMMHLVPGNPFDADADKPLPPQVLEQLNKHYHLDEPVYIQYFRYMGDALQGKLGPSYAYLNRTVNEMIAEGFPISFQLGVYAMVLALLIGIPLGIISALRQNTLVDYCAMFFAVSGVSIHTLAMAPFVIWIFALELGWFPVARWGTWQHAILPATVLAVRAAALIARLTRASMLQVIHEDYIRTARAKGVSEKRIVIHHALRNALIPIITIIGPLFAGLISGSLIVEKMFAIPGMGAYYVDAVTARDYPVIMATTLLYAFVLILSNLAVDIAYSWLDPRIRKDQ
jgi:ABC-type dipeptide/oligopeptide/nickel transport system permease component